ncbi:hypothetical protein [Novosphingobium sp. 9]|uniref:hypothetical protein n=1 Tax=Novosphingobium sp. 9 TaxID=2025349 RepID=UPI0021B575FD|nr:hypothetical protein [Novosphingobium sp. 9]
MRCASSFPLLIGPLLLAPLLAGCGSGDGDAPADSASAVPASVTMSRAAGSSEPVEPVHVVAKSVFAPPGAIPADDASSVGATATPAQAVEDGGSDGAASVDAPGPAPAPTPAPAPIPTPLATPLPEKPAAPGPKSMPSPKPVSGSAARPAMVSPVGDTSAYPVGPSVPVRPGYYATGDTPCDRVSARTVLVLYRDGMDSAAGSCAWSEVQPVAGAGAAASVSGSWRVTRRCLVGQQEGVSDGTPYVRHARITLAGKGAFVLRDEGGAAPIRAKWCPQASLPEPWRSQPPIGG